MGHVLYLPEKLTAKRTYTPPTLKDRVFGPMFSQHTGEPLGFWSRILWNWMLTDDPRYGEIDRELEEHRH
jgi:hypothetical protein